MTDEVRKLAPRIADAENRGLLRQRRALELEQAQAAEEQQPREKDKTIVGLKRLLEEARRKSAYGRIEARTPRRAARRVVQ